METGSCLLFYVESQKFSTSFYYKSKFFIRVYDIRLMSTETASVDRIRVMLI